MCDKNCFKCEKFLRKVYGVEALVRIPEQFGKQNISVLPMDQRDDCLELRMVQPIKYFKEGDLV